MSACEKCWAAAGGSADRYRELLLKRKCTPEEQAGPDASQCPWCGRMTLHQITREAMCGCDASDAANGLRQSEEKS